MRITEIANANTERYLGGHQVESLHCRVEESVAQRGKAPPLKTHSRSMTWSGLEPVL